LEPADKQIARDKPPNKIIAEQAQWLSLGLDYLEHGGVDRFLPSGWLIQSVLSAKKC